MVGRVGRIVHRTGHALQLVGRRDPVGCGDVGSIRRFEHIVRLVVGVVEGDCYDPKSQQRGPGRPPAQRDKTAMNGAQLRVALSDSDDRVTCPGSCYRINYLQGFENIGGG